MISMENTVNVGACKREVLRGKKLFDAKTAAPCRKSCDGSSYRQKGLSHRRRSSDVMTYPRMSLAMTGAKASTACSGDAGATVDP